MKNLFESEMNTKESVKKQLEELKLNLESKTKEQNLAISKLSQSQ